MQVIGYGICGPGEADRYLKQTLGCFKDLCDRTVICLNNAGNKEKNLIQEHGFEMITDNREWGKEQWRIKEDFVRNLDGDWFICLDMDETMETNRQTIDELIAKGGAGYYCYIQNLIDTGYSPRFSFWNIRLWNGEINRAWEHKPLHCGLAPKDAYFWGNYAPIIVKHFGLKDKKSREDKLKRYARYDAKQQFVGKQYYQWLADPDKVPLADIQSEITNYVNNTYFKKYKPMAKNDNIYHYVKTVDGRVIDVPDRNLPDELSRGSVLISKDPIIKGGEPVKTTKVKDPEPETKGLVCSVCGFEAKTKASLKTHSRKHND